MHEDRFGLPLSTTSLVAAEAYREGVDLLLSAWMGAEDCFERAIIADDSFALAHIGRARLHQMFARPAGARATAAKARELGRSATRREQQHIEILALSIEGKGSRALTALMQHLDEFPRDAVALSLALGAFGLLAFSGRADHDAARVDLCERQAAHYGEDWWFLTYRGWSHTEAGNIEEGRRFTERALELRRENANAAHALAHSLFERGDSTEGEAFLKDWLPLYDRAGILNGHISWHTALLALERGDFGLTLEIYDNRIRPGASLGPPLNVFTDSASLLWRMGLYSDGRVELPWADAADYGERAYGKAGVHFADVHYALATAACGRRDNLDKRIAELTALERGGKLAPGSVVIELCRAFAAFGDGDYAEAITLLEPVTAEIVRIGGSGAQRELCEDTLIVACLRSGRTERAAQLLKARLARRPSPRDARWLAVANA